MSPAAKTRQRATAAVLFLGAALVRTESPWAEVLTDGTMGPAAVLSGPDFAVSADLGTVRGANLFHSFTTLNLAAGESATFSGPDTIATIISRVTGGEQSLIDGRLASSIPGADLYLLNPAGVIFGPHASLDLSGSLQVSTADFLRLADQGIFFSDPSGDTILSSAAPTAFGFLDGPIGAIEAYGAELAVGDGQALSLIGGEIMLLGSTLRAPGGRIDLASVASAGEVRPAAGELSIDAAERGAVALNNSELDVDAAASGAVFIRGGRVAITGDAHVHSATGESPGGAIDIEADRLKITGGGIVQAWAVGQGDGGDVVVRSMDLLVANGSFMAAGTLGAGDSGSLDIVSDRVTVDGQGYGAGIFAQVNPGATGQGGAVAIDARDLQVLNGGMISASTYGAGDAGGLAITGDTITVGGQGVGAGIFAQVNPGATGQGGVVTINAGDLEVLNGSAISVSTFGAGDAGGLAITSDTLTVDGQGNWAGILAGVASGATGQGGAVTINVGDLQVLDGGQIGASTFGAGDAGRLAITSDTITVDGQGNLAGIFSRVNTGATGQGGAVTINAGDLQLLNGGRISAATFGAGDAGRLAITSGTIAVDGHGYGAGIFAQVDTGATGQGGAVTIDAGDLQVRNGGEISAATFGAGDAGGLSITSDTITVDGQGYGAGIYAGVAPGATGHGGAVTISSSELSIRNGGAISSSTSGAGDAGDLSVTSGTLTVDGAESGIYARVREGATGDGGDINLVADSLTLRSQGTITAASLASGRAGDIAILATGTLSLHNGSRIVTSTTDSDGGDITIRAGHLLRLEGSEISTSVAGGAGNGGNIDIDPIFTILQGSRIVANAYGGNGGNIQLVTDYLFADNSIIDASSRLGISGNVSIQTPDIDISGILADLPESGGLADLAASSCLTAGPGGASSLTFGGWGMLAPGPKALVLPVAEPAPERDSRADGRGKGGQHLRNHLERKQGEEP
ncbi:MAG: filamentous hemagglutinin N-terminal domain-containing protein [Thermodesulfobacteriota bacterium]